MAIDVTALANALQQDPDQRALLRRALLGEDADVPAALTRLADAQARTEASLEELTSRVDQLTGRVDELAQAQARTEARLEGLTIRVDQLTGRVDELAKDVRKLALAQQRTEDSLKALVDVVSGMNDRLARLDGESFERRARERGHAYFQRIVRRLRPLDAGEQSSLVDDARRDEQFADLDVESLLYADAMFAGRSREDDQRVHLVVEASITLNRSDVRRARERADLLARIVDTPVIAVVFGEYAPEPVMVAAQDADVWQVVGGRTVRPQDDLDDA